MSAGSSHLNFSKAEFVLAEQISLIRNELRDAGSSGPSMGLSTSSPIQVPKLQRPPYIEDKMLIVRLNFKAVFIGILLMSDFAYAQTLTKPRYSKSCVYLYNHRYLPGPSHKAFAFNAPAGVNRVSDNMNCWSTDTQPTKAFAISHALKACAKEAARRGGFPKCRIFAAE